MKRGGFETQSHTVASVSVKDEIVESDTVVNYAFDPDKTRGEKFCVLSPTFGPVSLLSHMQDRGRNIGSSPPVDPLPLVIIEEGGCRP